MTTVTVYKEVEIELDLSKIQTDDLVAELDSRLDSPYCETPNVEDMYNALRDGNTALVLKLAKEYVERYSDRIVV